MIDFLDECYSFFHNQLGHTQTLHKDNNHEEKTTNSLILTHPSHLHPLIKRRYRTAAHHLLAHHKRGEFRELGPLVEWLGLESDEAIDQSIFLIEEAVASAYGNLAPYMAHSNETTIAPHFLIHMHIGSQSIEIAKLETFNGAGIARITHNYGTQSGPIGSHILDYAIMMDCLLLGHEAALACSQIEQGGEAVKPFDLSEFEHFVFAPWSRNPPPWHALWHAVKSAQIEFRQNYESLGDASLDEEAHFQVQLAASDELRPLFKITDSDLLQGGEKILWQGNQNQKLITQSDATDQSWKIILSIPLSAFAAQGCLTDVYLSFLTDILIESLETIIPDSYNTDQILFSVTGKGSLFPPLQAKFSQHFDNKQYKAIPFVQNYDEERSITTKGAIDFIATHCQAGQGNIMHARNGHDLAFVSGLSQNIDLAMMIKRKRKQWSLDLIETASKSGFIDPEADRLKLVETISGLSYLLQDPEKRLSYFDDLEKDLCLSKQQISFANNLWYTLLDKSYRVLLDLPLTHTRSANDTENMLHKETPWHYHALRSGEAKLTIGAHKYWLSAGLADKEN